MMHIYSYSLFSFLLVLRFPPNLLRFLQLVQMHEFAGHCSEINQFIYYPITRLRKCHVSIFYPMYVLV